MTLKLLLLLAVTLATGAIVGAQRRRVSAPSRDEWNYRDGSDRVNMKSVANLTQVLDDWRFDILSQMRGLLQNDHQALLPDYARIQPLSEALEDLYKEFTTLKSHLGDLTEKFSAVEAFIDELKANQAPNARAPAQAPTRAPAPAPAPRRPGRRIPKQKATST